MTYYHKRKLEARQQAEDLLNLYERTGYTPEEYKTLQDFLKDLASRTGNTFYFKQKGYIKS